MRKFNLKDGPLPLRDFAQPYQREREVVPEDIRYQDELDAAHEWLRHVEAGRIGGRRD